MKIEKLRPGFWYDVETFDIKTGKVLQKQRVHNLVPTEGETMILQILFAGLSVPAAWYLGLFESNYTPVPGITAASMASVLTESTAYNEVTRQQFVPGAPAAGSVDNSASPAVFTFNAAKTIYGGFISTNSAKSGATGTLISCAKFATPMSVGVGTAFRATTGFSLSSS